MDGVIDILLQQAINEERDPKVRQGLQKALEIVQTSGYYNLEDLEDENYNDGGYDGELEEEEEPEQHFWNTNVSTADEIQDVVEEAVEAGTTYEDIDDYLNVLYDMGKVSDAEVSYFLNWAYTNYFEE